MSLRKPSYTLVTEWDTTAGSPSFLTLLHLPGAQLSFDRWDSCYRPDGLSDLLAWSVVQITAAKRVTVRKQEYLT